MTAVRFQANVKHRSPRWDRLRRFIFSDRGAQITATIAFLVGWQLLTLIAPRVPGPIAVVGFLYIEMTGGSHGGVLRGQFWGHFAATLQRYAVGMFMGFVGGVLVGVLVGSSSLARALINDTVLVLLAMPVFVWAFLTTMWFGIGWQAPTLTVALSALPYVAINVAQGVRAITPDLRTMSTAFGVSRWKRFRHLTIAGIMGYVFAGLRFAMLISWNGVLLSEWFNGQNGVGFRTRYWFDANRYRGFVGWVVSFILFIVLLDRLVLNPLQERSFRWRNPGGELPEPITAA
jgi:ABC-type nitrate/sulfonate/bicarbonate transport system permease component